MMTIPDALKLAAGGSTYRLHKILVEIAEEAYALTLRKPFETPVSLTDKLMDLAAAMSYNKQ